MDGSEVGQRYEAIVAGHICLDIIPSLHGTVVLEPGRLVEAGPASLSTGGAVSNTGRALAKLGVSTRLMGKIGDDLFGRAIVELLGPHGSGMVVTPGEPTSYTVVVNLSGKDRTFIHAPGCNNTFSASDVSAEDVAGARLMHFGYPTLMARMFANGGEELVRLFRMAKDAGVMTSLDMSLPDPQSPAGQADWRGILEAVLPYVDLFLPNAEELAFMVDRASFDGTVASDRIPELARECLEMGSGLVGVKAGSRGFYVRSGSRPSAEEWRDVELWSPAFSVEVQGTTGAGDATIAGFLCGVLNGQGPITSARMAVATGAFCCERPDATSGLPNGSALLQRMMDVNWRRLAGPEGSDWRALLSGEFVRREA
jgi:sugar/nucleoside kinase (ribokinase family)